MGKKSRMKMQGENLAYKDEKAERLKEQESEQKEEKRIFTRTRAWMKKTQMAFKDMSEDACDKEAMRARSEFIPRWMTEAGIDDWKDMDFVKFPQIHLEYELCDPGILRALQKPGGRELLFKRLTEEEQYIYLNEKGDEGRTYAEDLEGRRGFNKRNIVKTVYKYKKSKKMAKTV